MSRIALGLGLGVTQRVGAGGGPPEPSEFITNGNFAAGSANWVLGAGWTVVAGVAANGASTTSIGQNFGALVDSLINGNNYVFSVDLTNSFADTVVIELSGDGGQTVYADTGTGLITQPFTALGAMTTLSLRADNGELISIDNVSIVPA